jgi:hypothetical protein
MTLAAVKRPRPETVAPDLEALLRDIAAEQQRQAAVLANILRALERGRGSLPVHVALLVAITEAIGDREFTGAQLFAHARVAPALRDALEACDLTSAREFGWLARRLETNVLPGVRLDRVGESRDGLVWRVWVSSGETRDD